jgi:hypothetical protein
MEAPESRSCTRFQLHIYSALKRLQPVEDSAVFAPGVRDRRGTGFTLAIAWRFISRSSLA